MKTKNKFILLWLIIGLIAGFATIVFISINYVNESVMCHVDCNIKDRVNAVIIAVSLAGLFVGSLTYYFISEKYERKIIQMTKDTSASLRFLEKDDQIIIKYLIDKKGEATQSDIVKDTGLSRVKISRYVSNLEKKSIVEKKRNGMTNLVILKEDLSDILIK